MLVDDLLDTFLRLQSYHLVNYLPALEEQKRRNTPDVKLDGGVRVVVDVELADCHRPRIVGGECVDGRGQALAGPAPFGPKVDEHGSTGLENGLFEVGVSKGLHVIGGHAGGSFSCSF